MDSLTPEQQLILKTAETVPILLVKAKAGTGKSYTSYKLVEHLKPKTALYTAFNKAIITEGEQTLKPLGVECRTFHALAYNKVKPKLPIEAFTYTCIKENLPYAYKKVIIDAMDEFYRSASLETEEFLHTYIAAKLALFSIADNPIHLKKMQVTLETLAESYIQKMIEEKIPPTFNYLLKWFHFLLANGEVKLEYDLVIIDEIQDTTGVALEIFKLLTATHKIGLGDPHQRIYLFMHLVNGFELLSDVPVLELTKTFRCSTQIANNIRIFGKKWLNSEFKFEGIEHPMHDGKVAYITATNASIVRQINILHREGKGYILTRPIKEIFAAPLAVVTAATGKAVYHKQYKFLEDEYKTFRKSHYINFFKYLAEEVQEEEIKNTVRLLNQFSRERINIFDVLNEAKASKRDPRITVGTAFSLKGLGYETVYIDDDLNNQVQKVIDNGGPETEKQLVTMRLYYVACSRSRCNLYNARLLPTEDIELKEQ